jgi:glycosyltransferase involved in cell wall biosynthesis
MARGTLVVKSVACRPAWKRTSNRFTYLFSRGVELSGWKVREFGWSWTGLFAPKVILLHWPDEMFTARTMFQRAKVLVKLAGLRAAKAVRGAKIVWMVHETQPHDARRTARGSTRAFLSLLDGAIFLSEASRRVSLYDMPELARIPHLVTRHGHYRDDLIFKTTERSSPGKRLELLYFGQIRPYKNLEALIRAAATISPEAFRITVLGWSKDATFTDKLKALATEAPAVRLDIRDSFVLQEDLEHAIANCDAVVLPYRKILNSGAALLALSCNRPVLAPRLGSLPELQTEIGEQWVHLYDGEIHGDAIQLFSQQLRKPAQGAAPLSLYDWPEIGHAVGKFFDELSLRRARRPRPELQAERGATWR